MVSDRDKGVSFKVEAFMPFNGGVQGYLRTVSETHLSHLEVSLLSLEVGERRRELDDLVSQGRQLLLLSQLVQTSTRLGDVPLKGNILIRESRHLVAEADGKKSVDVGVESIASFRLSLTSQDVNSSGSIDLNAVAISRSGRRRQSQVQSAIKETRREIQQ